MSGLILSTIFDFRLEGKLRCIVEEADLYENSKHPKTETRPEVDLRKSEREETGVRGEESGSDEDDDDDDNESIDSDSDATLTNEIQEDGIESSADDEEEDGGCYYSSDEGEEGIFEYEITTIPEESEDEEEDEEKIVDLEETGISTGVERDCAGAGEIDPLFTEKVIQVAGVGVLDVCMSSRCSGELDLKKVELDEPAQKRTGISTEVSESVGESGTEETSFSLSNQTTEEDEERHDSSTTSYYLHEVTPTTPSPSPGLLNHTSHTECLEETLSDTGSHLTQILSPSPLLTHYSQQDNKDDETGMHTMSQQRLVVINGQESRLRSVLRKPGNSKQRKGRCVTFNESLNLFYDAECSCWVHEDEYTRYRQEEFERREELYHYEPLPLPTEFDEPPTLSPPEGYKDRFFPQDNSIDPGQTPYQARSEERRKVSKLVVFPDVTRVSPPSPPTARRKVFLRENPTLNGQEEEEPEEESSKKKGLRLGGILKGGRLWRSNSSDGKKVVSPPEEPDVVKCTESSSVQTGGLNSYATSHTVQDYDTPLQPPTKVSIGTAPLRTSEQIRLAVDSTLRLRKNKKPECSTLVEKLRWLTSLDDNEDSSDSSQSGFATWPSRDKNGLPLPTNNQIRKSDAGTSTNEEHFVQSSMIRMSSHEAKIKQISYTLEDIEEGLKGTDLELETFVSKDGGRIERIRKRYGEEGGDDYGFSRRPSVKGIKPKFSSTTQIFAQFTNRKSMESPALLSAGNRMDPRESEYENTRLPVAPPPPVGTIPTPEVQQIQSDPARSTAALNYEFQNTPGRQTEESRAHFEMIRQSFEAATAGGGPNFVTNYNRPHSWSVSTLPHPHHNHNLTQHSSGILPLMGNHVTQTSAHVQQQPIYGTVRRVPNVIGRPLFLHYGALSVEAHPNKIPYPPQASTQVKIPETPSPTQQTPAIPVGMRYYGPPIRYYNQPPPVPPRTITANPLNSSSGPPVGVVIPAPVPIGINNLNMPPGNPNSNHSHPHVNVMSMNEVERGAPEGATDEEPLNHKEAYSMNV